MHLVWMSCRMHCMAVYALVAKSTTTILIPTGNQTDFGNDRIAAGLRQPLLPLAPGILGVEIDKILVPN
ncbi:hypothetical protein DERP_006300 [Dermatophagoides pteronyssinus]|uniref:Uncharacterized protein n=1 Tax=Dermatophagoides pteronyssinus TaxID=6956 RepID=A0ABQ8IY20_DERPT|nr:hypothetical protein DERP_006300 [Dermatophagoides pteronyssinus]